MSSVGDVCTGLCSVCDGPVYGTYDHICARCSNDKDRKCGGCHKVMRLLLPNAPLCAECIKAKCCPGCGCVLDPNDRVVDRCLSCFLSDLRKSFYHN